jgi:hypothetical protein
MLVDLGAKLVNPDEPLLGVGTAGAVLEVKGSNVALVAAGVFAVLNGSPDDTGFEAENGSNAAVVV